MKTIKFEVKDSGIHDAINLSKKIEYHARCMEKALEELKQLGVEVEVKIKDKS